MQSQPKEDEEDEYPEPNESDDGPQIRQRRRVSRQRVGPNYYILNVFLFVT